MSENDSLSSFQGADSLQEIGGDFQLSNPLLQKAGLEQLQNIGGSLRARANDGLGNFIGLENLQGVGGDLYITSNPDLEDFSGLESLEDLGEDLTSPAMRIWKISAASTACTTSPRTSTSPTTRPR